MVLCWDGAVLACGRNYRGQLGQDPSSCTLNERGHPYCATFTQVESLQGFKMEKIACGGEHSAAIGEDGSLYIWGDDSCGQLAHAEELCDGMDDEPKSLIHTRTACLESRSCRALWTLLWKLRVVCDNGRG